MNRLFQKILKRKPKPNKAGQAPEQPLHLPEGHKEGEKVENYDEIIGKMAAFFAHEIRNPLTSIIGFTQFLEQDETVKENPNIGHYLTIIKEEALRVESLIKELLSLSTTDFHKDNLSIIDVKSIVEKTITIFQMKPEYSDVRFTMELQDEIYITGNDSRFEQLLINLVKNAIEATDEQCKIHTKVTKEQDEVAIYITDNGPGIPEEQIEQIFYPFYTTKEEGTGVGLPICKAIVETLKGTITFHNLKHSGTQVRIRLPRMKHPS